MKRLRPTANGDDPAVVPEQPSPEGPRGPGRPKLGVVAREVTLLPRHWDWLNSQPGGRVRRTPQARRTGETRQ